MSREIALVDAQRGLFLCLLAGAQAIRLAQGNQAKAAAWLGVTRLKMREKLTQYGLRPLRDVPGE